MNSADLIDAFDDLLDTERTLVLAGEIEALGRLAVRKQALLTRLSGAGTGAGDLARLRQDLAHNARLLSAAGQGIRDALDRVRSLVDPAPLATYDGQGRRNELAAATPSVSHSA